MAKTSTPAPYENNPFFVAANGISLVFNLARGVAILFLVLSVLGLFRGNWSADTQNDKESLDAFWTTLSGWSVETWLIAIGGVSVVLLALMLISALFGGVSAYTSLKLSRNEAVSIGEAFRVSFEHLWSFLWLQIIVTVKLFLWTLLLIVPGIIMATKYSLASVAFFDDTKNLRGNAAIKESIRLTKNAWLTTFGSLSLFNYITFGVISSLVTTGANAVLYRQYEKVGDKKPAAHWLSWLALALPFAVLFLLFGFLIFLFVVIGISGQSFS